MAKGNANKYMLWIESATPGTYNLVKGQKNLKRSGSRDKVETSTKDSGGYKTYQMNLSDLGWTVDLIPDLPDATGYTRLETLVQAGDPFNIQVRKGGTTGASGDVIFACSMYAGITSGDFGQNAPVGVSLEFVPATAPTTDTLAV